MKALALIVCLFFAASLSNAQDVSVGESSGLGDLLSHILSFVQQALELLTFPIEFIASSVSSSTKAVTIAPATQAPATQAPVTDAPVNEVPVNQPPVIDGLNTINDARDMFLAEHPVDQARAQPLFQQASAADNGSGTLPQQAVRILEAARALAVAANLN